MVLEELAANMFRSTQAEAKLRRDQVRTKDAANAIYHKAGQLCGGLLRNWAAPCQKICRPSSALKSSNGKIKRH